MSHPHASRDGDATQKCRAPELPRREGQVLSCLLAGRSEKEVAVELGISPHTVHVYVKLLYRRFSACSRAELLSRWIEGAAAGAD